MYAIMADKFFKFNSYGEMMHENFDYKIVSYR